MRKLFWPGFFAATLTLLGGCSTLDKLNPFSSSPTKSKPAELVQLTPVVNLQAAWQTSIGGSEEFVFTPAVVGNSVYAAARDGSVARFDDGRQAWRISAGQVLSGGVGSDGKLVVVGTPKGEVLSFEAASGKELWRVRVSSEVLAAPAIGDGLVVVRSGDARIYGFEAADGKRRWVYQRSTPALSLRSHAGLVLAGRSVLAGFPGGRLVSISTANGAALWESAVAIPKGATELERVTDVTSNPIVTEREVCAVAYQGRAACFDLNNGNQLWTREITSSAGLDADAKAVYVSDDKGAVQAFDKSNGSSLWKQDKLFMRGLSRPLVLRGTLGKYVAVADYQGVVHLLRAEDGGFAGRFMTDGSTVSADLQPAKDGLVVQTQKGGIFALSAK
jgi:outer membrane protein assembly factor BamB